MKTGITFDCLCGAKEVPVSWSTTSGGWREKDAPMRVRPHVYGRTEFKFAPVSTTKVRRCDGKFYLCDGDLIGAMIRNAGLAIHTAPDGRLVRFLTDSEMSARAEAAAHEDGMLF